jgi:glycosyltransferase involved in cell wall biosynthesis
MKIAVLGTRGFPYIQGGVEAHCEKLYPLMAKMGCDVVVFTRKPYVNPQIETYKDVKLVSLNCPQSKSFEAIVHTFKGVFAARRINPDILHIHAIGPAVLVPLARVLGMKVVMTTQGSDYKRDKWGLFAKIVLRLGEALGSYFSNQIICVTQGIADNIKEKYRRNSFVIPNGVAIPEVLESSQALREYALTKGKYILTVGRFVPEKRFCDLIDAFDKARLKKWKLVIVGRADYESKYSRDLKEKAGKNGDIVLTGFLKGRPLQEVYSHAGLFVLPSYHEGLPIALLEAMSYGLLCLASDIPAHRSLFLPDKNYFPAGDVQQLTRKLKEFTNVNVSRDRDFQQIEMTRQKYSWETVARKTLQVYKKTVSEKD